MSLESAVRVAAPPAARPTARWAALVPMVLLLAACALPPAGPMVPSPLTTPGAADSSNARLAPTPAVVPQTRVERLPAPPAVPQGRPEPPPRVPPPAQAISSEPMAVNLEQVTLATFAQVVYADMLKRNVNIDPQVLARRDLVTFRSGGTQSPEAIENAARLLLRSYGVAAVDIGGLVRVVPDNAALGNLPEIRRGAALPDTPQALRPIFQLVELTSVRQTEVGGWLRTMFGERVRFTEDATRNALLISSTPDTMGAVLDAIRVLDTPVLAGVQSASITPVHWSADDLARRLFEVLTAQGYAVQPLGQAPGGARFPIILLPVAGLNSVYIFARGDEVLRHAVEWARTLDKPNERGIGRNFFTYQVRNTDAVALAATVEQLITGVRPVARPAGATGTAPAAAAPAGGAANRPTTVVVDRATNTMIFQANQEDHAQILSLLQMLDRPTRGALIEVTVAELSLDNNNQFGIEWLATQGGFGSGSQAVAGTQGGLAIGSSGFNFRVFDSAGGLRVALNALASNNQASILSSPRVLARNGETATIQVGQEVPIITSQQTTGTTGAAGAANVLQTIQYRNTGVILRVRPVIHSGDQIDLDVSQEVSAAAATSTGVNNSPTFSTRKIDTRLTLKNGATVMLGGLISEDTSQGNAGIPLLKDLPLVGGLFNTQQKRGNRRELIVLITPYVIADDHDAAAVTDAFRRLLGPWSGTQGPVPPQPLVAPASPPAPPR